jgi:hypothetical protein
LGQGWWRRSRSAGHQHGGERVFPEAVAKGHSGVFDEQVAEEAT